MPQIPNKFSLALAVQSYAAGAAAVAALFECQCQEAMFVSICGHSQQTLSRTQSDRHMVNKIVASSLVSYAFIILKSSMGTLYGSSK